ncbi:hypothetical protein HCY52_08050 [Acinetobacter radioresistens]|uniref:hypothetical protein n=1 Tax=Acinetobacter radioresistens TaxID=40216 RepID=UPI00200521ED|nr:hypothetical protein [Acinetobacter radioresistens]MCK4083767.1 hypothetical protein [Acinetobacter radioresistens]
MIHPLHKENMLTHKHQMFYDESNNFRKLILDKEIRSLNIDRPEFNNSIFYLGGIAFKYGCNNELEIERAYFDFKNTVNKTKEELKFDDVAQNDFFSVLKSPHLYKFLKLLVTHEVCIHYQSIDMIYMVVTDLIDEYEVIGLFYKLYPMYTFELGSSNICAYFKNVLQKVFNENKATFFDFIGRTNFPQISDSEKFIIEFIEFIKSIRTDENRNKISMILNVFENIEDKGSIFIDGYPEPENNLILVNSFSGMYCHRIATLSNCIHIFDEEEGIQDAVIEMNKNSDTKIGFVDSIADFRIQMSDIMIGFVRKFTDYHLTESFETIRNNFYKMNPFQKQCIGNYLKLEDYSEDICEFFFLAVLPLSDKEKMCKVAHFYKTELGLKANI